MIKFFIIIFITIILFYVINTRNNKEKFTNLQNKMKIINNNLTICIKTLYRKKLLYEHLKMLRGKFPDIKIIISDDSDDNYKIETKNLIKDYLNHNIEYIELPYDSGLSKGRNECISRVKTPYVIVTDDSRCIDTELSTFFNILTFLKVNEEYGLITGHCPQRNGYHKHFTKTFYLDDNKNMKYKNIDKSKFIKYKNIKFYNNNLGINCIIGRTNIFKKYKWANKLKIGEHKTFFRQLFYNNIKVLYCENLIFKQFNNRLRKYDKNGSKLRKR